MPPLSSRSISPKMDVPEHFLRQSRRGRGWRPACDAGDSFTSCRSEFVLFRIKKAWPAGPSLGALVLEIPALMWLLGGLGEGMSQELVGGRADDTRGRVSFSRPFCGTASIRAVLAPSTSTPSQRGRRSRRQGRLGCVEKGVWNTRASPAEPIPVRRLSPIATGPGIAEA